MKLFGMLTLSALALAPLSLAQSVYSVVPPSAATTRTNGDAMRYMFYYTTGTPMQPVHLQMVYDNAIVSPNPAPVLIKGINYRRTSYYGNTCYAGTATLSVSLSSGPNDSSTTSSVFANNLGGNTAQVFSGNVNLPDSKLISTAPFNPFEVKIPLSKPFPHVGSSTIKSLVVDMTITKFVITSTTGSGIWYVDMIAPNTGSVTSNWYSSQCKYSTGKYPSSYGYMRPNLGGNWYVYDYYMPKKAVGLGAIGVMGKGNWMGLTLPFDLAGMGAPNCKWACSMEIVMPLVENYTGTSTTTTYCRWPSLKIPNVPALGGANFYSQGVFLDPKQNALGAVPSRSHKWTIGTGLGAGGSYVQKYRDSAVPATSGSLYKNSTVIMQIVH